MVKRVVLMLAVWLGWTLWQRAHGGFSRRSRLERRTGAAVALSERLSSAVEGATSRPRLPSLCIGRTASTVPWMKACSFGTSSRFSLPVKSGMPLSIVGHANAGAGSRKPITWLMRPSRRITTSLPSIGGSPADGPSVHDSLT